MVCQYHQWKNVRATCQKQQLGSFQCLEDEHSTPRINCWFRQNVKQKNIASRLCRSAKSTPSNDVNTPLVILKTTLTVMDSIVLVATLVCVTMPTPFVHGPVRCVPSTLVTVVPTQMGTSSMIVLVVVVPVLATTSLTVPLTRFALWSTAAVFATKQSVQLTNIPCATT